MTPLRYEKAKKLAELIYELLEDGDDNLVFNGVVRRHTVIDGTFDLIAIADRLLELES